jgi:DNA-binding IclR family transcriptional regulator
LNAVSRALSVLDCFTSSEGPLGNQDLAIATGLAKSTISRITASLVERRYLTLKSDTGKYQLGPGIAKLSDALRRSNPLPDLIQPVLQDLAVRTRGTVGLGRIEGQEAAYVRVARGVSAIMLRVDIGSRMPLGDSALGLALLSGWLYSSNTIQRELPATLDDDARQRLEAAIKEFSKGGYCTSIGTWNEAINGVAAPIRVSGDDEIYAINIGAPAFLMKEDALHEIYGPALLETLNELERLGLAHPVFQSDVD